MTTPLDPYASATSNLPSATQNMIPGNIIGANNQTINTAELNLSSSGGGAVYGYAGTPTAGNLTFSLSSASGTDSFGNTVPTGLNVSAGSLTGVSLIGVAMDGTSVLQNTTINAPSVLQPSIAGGTATSLVSTMTNGSGGVLGYVSATVSTTYATNGNYLWTCPTGITVVNIQCWGAGAGGGGGGSTYGGNAGGGGEYAQEPLLSVNPGDVYTITVGKGGGGGVTQAPGVDGGDTLFQDQNGGGTGVIANGGEADPGSYLGGSGGTGSMNTIHYDGGDGANAGNSTGASGGGGSGSFSGQGNDGTQAAGSTGAAGGAAISGGGAGGAGGNNATNGSNGGAPGGGGGGAGSNTTIVSSKSYQPAVGTYSYRGFNANTDPNELINHDGPLYQGFPNSSYGTQYSYMSLPWQQIQSDMAGVTITSCSLKIKCLYSYYSAGVYCVVQYSAVQSWGNTSTSSGGFQVKNFLIKQNQTLTQNLGLGDSNGLLGVSLQNGNAKSLMFFTELTPAGDYYGSFDSGANNGVIPTLIVYYNNGGGSTAGTGGDGQVILSYQSGTVPTFQLSVSATAGADVFGNPYSQGFTGPLLTLTNQSTTVSTNASASTIGANTAGTPTVTNSQGFTGQVPSYQIDTSVQTANGAATSTPTNITKAYVIPAGDAQLGTTYILEVPYTGVFVNPNVVEWGVNVNNGAGLQAQVGLGGGFFSVNTSILGTFRGKMQVTTAGGSGQATFVMDGGMGIAANRSSGVNNNNAYMSGIGTAISMNFNNPNTLSIYVRWSATATGQNCVGYGSTFTRIGP